VLNRFVPRLDVKLWVLPAWCVTGGAALPFGTAEPAPIRSALQKTRARARENDFIQTYVFFCVYGFDFANDKTV
jgi:hypothetical protein